MNKFDPYLIDSHKLHYHPSRVAQLIEAKTIEDKLNIFPLYVEISPMGSCNHRCLHGDTLINTIYGKIQIKEISEKYSTIPVYTYSIDKREVFISDAINIRKYGVNEKLVRVHFTDGTFIDCTPDHRFLDLDNNPMRADELSYKKRVRALRYNPNPEGYNYICWGRWGRRSEHRLAMDYMLGRKLESHENVHHIDHNPSNNHPNNLEYCASAKEHTAKHPEISKRMRENNPSKYCTNASRIKLSNSLKGKKRTLEQRLRYRESRLGIKNPNYKNGKNALSVTNRRSRVKEINHVVSHIEYLEQPADVYCMEVPATGWFFANDVLVKNCSFCAVDYIGYVNRKIDTIVLTDCLKDMANNGVKSVMFAGEGEPMLHPDIADITESASFYGLDVSFTTNGTALTKKFVEQSLHATKWIKISLNGGEKSYAKIHRTKQADYERVWNNIKYAASYRSQNNLSCAIGVQCVVLPENIDCLEEIIQRAISNGTDYIVLKPYSQHKSSITTQYGFLSYKEHRERFETLREKYSSERFKVIPRLEAMNEWDTGEQSYHVCHATPYLWGYIMATGDVYTCSAYLLNDDFKMGNINEQSFKDIWLGNKRREHIAKMEKLDISTCRINCRMNQVNKYLDTIKIGNEHANFI